jgi:hypothetical protein
MKNQCIHCRRLLKRGVEITVTSRGTLRQAVCHEACLAAVKKNMDVSGVKPYSAPTKSNPRKDAVDAMVRRGLSYAKIGEHLGVSRQRAHQIHKS